MKQEQQRRIVLTEQATRTAKRQSASRRKRRSPEEILQRITSAAASEFMRSGFRGATTAAIARRADVTEAQLFRYFESKADLFRAVIFDPLNRRFSDFNAGKLGNLPPADNLREQARTYITDLQEFIGENAEMLMSLLVAEAYSPEGIKGVSDIDALGDYFERGATVMSRRLGEDARVDPELMVRVSFAAVLANVLFRDWLFPRDIEQDDRISAAIIDFVLDGIGANTDQGLLPTPN